MKRYKQPVTVWFCVTGTGEIHFQVVGTPASYLEDSGLNIILHDLALFHQLFQVNAGSEPKV
jgi:hypothetical protein